MFGFDAWLSLFGPAYFAFSGFSAPVMVVWAVACAGLAMWNIGQRRARKDAAGAEIPSRSWVASWKVFLFVAIGYVAAHTAVYLLVRYLAALRL
ncbi:MAG: hypothetical protein ABIQ51_21915 [Mesorhizobium sp.]